jgi:hypothetical protein
MGRSTFEGPILSGDNRFGPQRNVGYTTLTQSGYLNLLNTSSNTAGYGGGSTVFVNSNNIPNGQATVYVPSSTLPLGQNSTQAIPADTASQIYRGWVCYIPTGSDIDQAIIDVAVAPTVASGTLSTTKIYVSNNYTVEGGTATYATATISGAGRASTSFSGTQVTNSNSTSVDIVGVNGTQQLSQIVFTISLTGTTMTTISAGQIYFSIRYIQPDGNIGTTTAYPYGNFD